MIVAVVSLKGGSGKSTVARSLAGYWSVPLIDLDPQQTNAPFGACTTLPKDGPAVIDTPGFRGRDVVAALGRCDVAILPCRPSPDDIRVCWDSWRLVEEVNETEEREGNPVMARVVLTQTTPRTAIAEHTRQQLGLPTLSAELVNRVAHPEAAIEGTIPRRGAAWNDIKALAREVEQLGHG